MDGGRQSHAWRSRCREGMVSRSLVRSASWQADTQVCVPGGEGMEKARLRRRTPVIFVGGMGRSGSTLVARALGQVPGLVTVGELHYLWDQGVLSDRACSCGERFSSCLFWQQVGDVAMGGWDRREARRLLELRRDVVRNRYVPWLGLPALPGSIQSARDDYARAVARVAAAVLTVSGARALVDTSKYPSSGYVMASSADIDLRLIHLVRRSEGVAHSWMKRVVRPDREDSEFARFPPARTAAEWMAYNGAYDLLRLGGIAGFTVRYEDFVAAPGPTLRSILDHLGKPRARADLEFVTPDGIVLEDHHSIAGNPMKFRTGLEPLRLDDAWREEMPVGARWLVTGLTAPGLLRYGYLTGTRP